MELYEQIRREYEHGAGTIRAVARKVGVHRREVRKALASAVPAQRRSRGRVSNLVHHEHRKSAGDIAPLRRGVGNCGVLPKPSIKFFEPHSACLVEVQQERKCVGVVEFQPVAVDVEESGCHGHCDKFVSIHERMVLREALPESGGFLNQVTVVPAAGSRQSRL